MGSDLCSGMKRALLAAGGFVRRPALFYLPTGVRSECKGHQDFEHPLVTLGDYICPKSVRQRQPSPPRSHVGSLRGSFLILS